MSENNNETIETVVIPVGGYGTRMGERTRAIGKPMLPVGPKPLITYAVDEAVAAGASRIIIPCRPEDEDIYNKQFLGNAARDAMIHQNARHELMSANDGEDGFTVEVVPVYEKAGPASTIARLIDERGLQGKPFGVILPDDLILPERGKDDATLAMGQMAKTYNETGKTTVGSRETDDHEKPQNVTFVQMETVDGVSVMKHIQIKPKDEDPVSKQATCGRYIFDGDFVDTVNSIDTEGLKEVSMSAVVRAYAQEEGKGVAVLELQDVKFYDCGEDIGYSRAVARFIPTDILLEAFQEKADPKIAVMSVTSRHVPEDKELDETADFSSRLDESDEDVEIGMEHRDHDADRDYGIGTAGMEPG